MIAPLKTSPAESDLAKSKRLVLQRLAGMLLVGRQTPLRKLPPVPAWRAWLLALWTSGIAIAYLWAMLSSFLGP